MTADLQRRTAFYNAVLACGAIVYAVARNILARPTPASRDHVIVIGERALILARLDVEVPCGDGETYAVVTLAREELLEKIADSAVAPLAHVTRPAPAGEVHVASVSSAGIAAGPLPLAMLAMLAAASEDLSEVASVTMREDDSREGRRPS